MVFYLTESNPLELADNSCVFALENPLCLASSNRTVVNHLIGKMATAESINADSWASPVTSYGYDSDNKLSADVGLEPIDNLRNKNHMPSCKLFTYLTFEKDIWYLQIVYKEIKQKEGVIGDNNKFDIVSQQTTVTDLNGATVLVGQKRVELPYQFDGEQL